MRRIIGILLLTGLLLVLVWPLPALAGGLQSTGPAASETALRADFNGDGAADLAVGAPGENSSSGVVHVLYGSATVGLTAAGSQLWSQDSPGIAGGAEAGDIFGFALAAGDFNGDTRADLAIGAPGENSFAGVVHVLYGSGTGLTAAGNQLWSQDSPGIAGVAEAGDAFGLALAAGDFNGNARADLAIGAPDENSVGVVHVLYGSGTGLAAVGSQLWSQDSPGIAGGAEAGDAFGLALAAADFNGDARADLAIGAPAENNFTGVVHVLYGAATVGLTAAGSQLWSQDSPGIAGSAEPSDEFGAALAAGDFNGDTRADLAIGAPGENSFAGVAHVLYGSATVGLTAAGSQLWSQDSPGIAGVAEAGDGFGFALVAGDFNGDARADLAIGAPGENSSSGVVQVLYGSGTGLTATGSQLWSQDSPGIAGGAEPDDIFGEALAAGDFNGDTRADLAIGALGENSFAGVAHVLYGAATVGLTAAGSQLWSQDSPGIAGAAEAGDAFGETLAAGTLSTGGGAGTDNPAAASQAERSRTGRQRRP
jgi:disulfide bond formation protein DsbB